MQMVNEKSEFDSALRLCQGRAESAFGDSRVFIEEYVSSAEHIEFQVVGDGSKAIHLGERCCSIQRRHQKILEEGPWISRDEREDIGARVVAGAEAIGYRGLATFEFLRNSEGEFYFMEVNPRVQVEHTVTEMLTGIDLVSLGIIVSSGADLPITQEEVALNGHAIQVRINAENPVTLEPSPGKLWDCHWPGGPGIRVDSHGFSGYVMPEAFDSLLAKIISWAPNRNQAIGRLDSALEETILLGVDTLIPLHRAILQESDFIERKISTDYLETHADLLVGGD
jgi:biotin carboxylase